MKTRLTILILLIFLIVITSCQQQSVEVESILQSAETLIEQHPDSALVLLEEVPNSQSLKKSLYYRYFLLQIQAKDKSYRDITSDTLIFDVQKYYNSNNDKERTALASFYCGRVLQENKNYEDALQIYLEADNYLKPIENNNLKGLYQAAIGEIYYHQLLTDNAIIHFKRASEYFESAEKYKNEIMTLRFMGNAYLIQKQIDSAFVYLSKALDKADLYKIEREQLNTMIGLGIAYRQNKDWKKSESFYRQARSLATDSLDKAKIASNFVNLFESEAKNDSVEYYLQLAENHLSQKINNSLAANIYKR